MSRVIDASTLHLTHRPFADLYSACSNGGGVTQIAGELEARRHALDEAMHALERERTDNAHLRERLTATEADVLRLRDEKHLLEKSKLDDVADMQFRYVGDDERDAG